MQKSSEVFLNTERSEVLLTLSFYIERSEVFFLSFSHLSEVFPNIESKDFANQLELDWFLQNHFFVSIIAASF